MIGKAIGLAAAPVIGAAVGTVAGAAWGGNTPGSDIGTTAAAGAVAGASMGVAATAIATHPVKTAKAVGTVGMGVGGVALGLTEAVGAGAIKGAELTGAAAINSIPMVAHGIGKYASAAAGLGNKLIKPTNNPNNMLGHKMTGLGAGLVVGSALLSGTQEAFNSFNRNRMGQSDGQITRATPRTPSYAQNAGATGDLVFAMNRNRRG